MIPIDLTDSYVVQMELVSSKKGFLSEYGDVKAPEPVDTDIRPVGIPQVQNELHMSIIKYYY